MMIVLRSSTAAIFLKSAWAVIKNAKKVREMHACRHLGNPRRVVRIPGDLAFTSAENTDKNVDHRCTPGTCVFDMRVVDAQEK